MNRDVHGGRSAARTLLTASDFALSEAVRDHDSAAHTELLARHGNAVAALAQRVPGGDTARAFSEAFDRMHAVDNPFMSLRVAWLAELAGTGRGLGESGNDAIWAAFRDLSSHWQTAIWHRYVEKDDLWSMARVLGVTPAAAGRTATQGRALLTRKILATFAVGGEPDCRRIRLFVEDNPALDARNADALGDHARRCQDCRPMLLELVRIEEQFAEVLAQRVLGSYATDYLAAAPYPRHEGVRATAPDDMVRQGSTRSLIGPMPQDDLEDLDDQARVVSLGALRPALRLLAASAAAAAVVGIVISTQSTSPDSLQVSRAPDVAAQGASQGENEAASERASKKAARKAARKRAALSNPPSTAPVATPALASQPQQAHAGDTTPAGQWQGTTQPAAPAPAPPAPVEEPVQEAEPDDDPIVSVKVTPPGGVLGPIEVEVPLSLSLLG